MGFVYIADRFIADEQSDRESGRYVWLPLDISASGRITVTWLEEWTLDLVGVHLPRSTTRGHSAGADASPSWPPVPTRTPLPNPLPLHPPPLRLLPRAPIPTQPPSPPSPSSSPAVPPPKPHAPPSPLPPFSTELPSPSPPPHQPQVQPLTTQFSPTASQSVLSVSPPPPLLHALHPPALEPSSAPELPVGVPVLLLSAALLALGILRRCPCRTRSTQYEAALQLDKTDQHGTVEI